MDKLLAVVQYILNMGPTVILPITIVVLGMIFRIKFTKALKSGLTIGIGFVGINLVVNLLTSTLGPAAQGMVERFGLNLTVIDVGQPTSI
uniref:PTS transporter subunit IIC n=1 Tax=Clostridioides difficile TaxID=1496 RepID=UPI002FCD7335